ncbi:hypothetical protein N7454_001578 [Penicillium verhagenii]|nr:hypothetical protein N7454_001578 [Penicillium verhagenii]
MTTVQSSRSTSRGSDHELAYASPVILESKGADWESIQRHNSLKEGPRSSNHEYGKIGNDGRNRRARGCSDDEGKLSEDGFSNEDLRVGGPYLCGMPQSMTQIDKSNPTSSLFDQRSANSLDLRTRISNIIHNKGIRTCAGSVRGATMELYFQKSKFNPEPNPVPTITITATRDIVDDTWLQAVREIYALLCEENFGYVSVEIRDAEALETPYICPVQPDDDISAKWDLLLGTLLRSVELRDISSIGCFRRGRSEEASENAPTVLVVVNVDSQKCWKATRDEIAKTLDDFALLMVAVEIVKDRESQRGRFECRINNF